MEPLETTLRATEAHVEAAGWDQPNRLFWLRHHDGCIWVAEFPLADVKLGFHYPPAVLQALTSTIASSPPGQVLQGWYGWLLAVETWSAYAATSDRANTDRLEAARATRTIHELPERQESRLCYLGTADQAQLLLVRHRGHLFPQLHRTWHPQRVESADPVAQEFANLLTVSIKQMGGRLEQLRRPFFACPRCGRPSYHPEDRRQGYCGACHDFTGDPEGGKS